MLIGGGVHVEDGGLQQHAKSAKFTFIYSEEDIQ